MNELLRWIKLAKKLVDGSNPECPRCSKNMLDFQYVGNQASRLGYLELWCRSCNHGTHISRVQIPEGVEVISIDADPSELAERIPNYKPILENENIG